MKRWTCLLVLLAQVVQGQVLWDGGGGNAAWSNPLNWTGDVIPDSAAEVVLNHAHVQGSYLVVLPAGDSAVTVRSLRIEPGPVDSIRVQIASSNTAAPALAVLGGDYALLISDRATLFNASGASSGTIISVADSFMIRNGGTYVHYTERGHAALVNRLSRMPGTERGIFRFEVPGSSGYTISGSNRVYGTLILSARGGNGSRTYLSSGANPLMVRGDLEIEPGVLARLDYNADVNVRRHLVVHGTLDLADHTHLIVHQDLSGSGTITETASETAMVELRGTSLQRIQFSGTFSNNITLRVANLHDVLLEHSLLLPWRLELVAGRIFSSHAALLVLDTLCQLSSDSLNAAAFISGPVRKRGMRTQAYYRLPVGKGITQRWIALQQASGDVTVEFMKANPYLLNDSMSPGLDHISGIEYWSVICHGGALACETELSFDHVNSGGVTDLNTLVVAALRNGAWRSDGRLRTSGTAGSAGSVTSQSQITHDTLYLSLGSTSAVENLLPLKAVKTGTKRQHPQDETRAYPTVCTDKITMETTRRIQEWVRLSIYDIYGRCISTNSRLVPAGRSKIYLDLKRVIPGIYLLSVANKFNETITFHFLRR